MIPCVDVIEGRYVIKYHSYYSQTTAVMATTSAKGGDSCALVQWLVVDDWLEMVLRSLN